jgi:hypothetical protein
MTDRDVIERLQQVTAMGRIAIGRSTAPGHKDYWRWTVSRDGDAIHLMETLRPHMGQRRQAKIDEIFREWPALRAGSQGGRRRGDISPHRLVGDDCAGVEG